MKRALLLLLLLTACGPPHSHEWKVARDPSWFPNSFPLREVEVTAFSDQLIEAIAKEEGFRVALYPSSWSFIRGELEEGKVDGILTGISPTPSLLEAYDFSEIYLYVGPVVVVAEGSSISSLSDLNDQEVGISRGPADILVLSSLPDVMITEYLNLENALLGVWRGQVDAALAPALLAYTNTANFFRGKLKVVTPPLTSDGLRLVVKKGKSDKLLEAFNQRLNQMVRSSEYDQLQKKWGLDLEQGPPPALTKRPVTSAR